MTDKEFKRLGRVQLIEIIYQLQLQLDRLTEQNQKLEKDLTDKRFRISNAGNIAEAALEITDCFRNAQNAAEQYLNEINAMRAENEAACMRILTAAQEKAESIRAAAQAEADAILAAAQTKADAIIADTRTKYGDLSFAIEAILKEYDQDHSDNG